MSPLGTLHLAVEKFLWQAACYQTVHVSHFGHEAVDITLRLKFAADYADIYEVRGQHRPARGRDLEPELSGDQVILGYHGLDDVVRRTVLRFVPPPSTLTHREASWILTLSPGAEHSFTVEIGCERQPDAPPLRPLTRPRDQAAVEHGRSQAWLCRLTSVNGQLNAWFNRAVSDLHMLVTALPTGPIRTPACPGSTRRSAATVSSRRSNASGCARTSREGVLHYLAATQATVVDLEQDAEPGKILHETRTGEMATLKEMPYGKYYGSVDATPLFVLLAGAYYERTADLKAIEADLAQSRGGLEWIDKYGDLDGDGLVEYRAQDAAGPAASRLERLRRRHLSRRRVAGRRPRSHSARSRAMCSPPGRRAPGLPMLWVIRETAHSFTAKAEDVAPTIRGILLV